MSRSLQRRLDRLVPRDPQAIFEALALIENGDAPPRTQAGRQAMRLHERRARLPYEFEDELHERLWLTTEVFGLSIADLARMAGE